MMTYPNPYQTEANGELVPEVRKRIHAVREKLGYSWADLGAEFDFSNTFVHGISRDQNPQRIRSKHIDALIRSLQGLEVKAGIATTVSSEAISPAIVASELSLEDLVNAISAKGFNVSVSPKN